MAKWILPLLLMSGISIPDPHHQLMMDHSHPHAPEKFKASDVHYLHPDSVRASYLSVKAMEIRGFSGTDLDKLRAAFEVLERVVNSHEFKDRVINFKNSRGERRFASNDGLSNEEIFEKFMEGRETLQANTPHEMNFFLRLYYRRWSRVIGYTSGDTNLISINWKYFRNYRPHEVAGNLAHEWVHKLGLDHASAAQHDSAPYAIGYIVEEMAEQFLISPPQIASPQ